MTTLETIRQKMDTHLAAALSAFMWDDDRELKNHVNAIHRLSNQERELLRERETQWAQT